MVTPFIRQAWTVSGVLFNIIGIGFMLGFPACLLPGLKNKESDIIVDSEAASWIASCVGLSGIPGLLISSYLMDKCGGRISHALLMLPGVIGWIIIYLSKSVSSVITGRCFTGLTSGATVLLGAIIIGEYSSPENRGMFLNLKTAATCTGIISAHVLGNYCHWRTVALLGTLPHLLALLITCTWPESPSWLVMKKQFILSEKTFYWLQGKTDRSINEFNEMYLAHNDRLQNMNEDQTFWESVLVFLKKFRQKNFVKPVLIMTTAFILLEACGRHTFPAYALDMINGFNEDKSQTFYYTLGIDIITTSTTLFSSAIVKMYKRRTILFGSGISSLIVLLIICLYLFLVSKEIMPKDKPLIPLSLFGLYFVLSNIGCTPIPLALSGEIFPLAHRSAASAVSGILLSLILMSALKLTPALIDKLEVYGTFTVFAAFMAASLLYLYFTLPETKNRTLQEIEDFFILGRFQDDYKKVSVCNDTDEKDKIKMKIINAHDKAEKYNYDN